jgi:hypothetical protein
MKPSNAKFFSQLQAATQELDFPLSSASEPLNPLLWEVEVKGELTIENLLRSEVPNFDYYRDGGKIIKPVNLENYLQNLSLKLRQNDPEVEEKYQEVFQLLKTNFSLLEAVEIRSLDDPGDSFHLMYGTTKSGEWVGISPNIPAEWQEWVPNGEHAIGGPLLEVEPPQTAITLDLVTQLEMIFQDLVYCEPNLYSGFTGKGFTVRVGETRELMFNSLLDSIGYARTFPFQPFTAEDIEDDEPEEWEPFQALDHLLLTNLTNLRTYLFGMNSCYHIYSIGQMQTGDWAGVASIAVWT